MGKLGGRELNYSSDIDLMFVGDGPAGEVEAAARALMAVTRPCFRVDLNLRPEGRDGSLVRTVESYEAYWDQWAEPWEFQALLKARAGRRRRRGRHPLPRDGASAGCGVTPSAPTTCARCGR